MINISEVIETNKMIEKENLDVRTIDIWAAVTGIILFWGIKKIAGLRVDKRIEEEGLDIYEHGESCYN